MPKRFLTLILFLIFTVATSGAELIVDDSVHSQIAKDYNLGDLPELPNNLKNSTVETIFTPNEFDTEPTSKYNTSQTTSVPTKTEQPVTTTTPPKTNPTTPVVTQPVQNNQNRTYRAITIKKGKKFKVANNSALSDSSLKGSTILFTTTSIETNKYASIPKGTLFKGTIVDSHTPNLTGNGGLLVIKVTQMNYNGGWYPVNAKITLANQKKVFFNNIKGKRMYWKNLKSKTSFGKKTYDRMWAKTKKYFKPGIEIIITPITFITGTVVYAANIAVSPILAIFSRGGKLSIPQGSAFEIKFLDDAVFYKQN